MEKRFKYILIFVISNILVRLLLQFGFRFILQFNSGESLTTFITFQFIASFLNLGLLVAFIYFIKAYLVDKFSIKLVIAAEFFVIFTVLLRWVFFAALDIHRFFSISNLLVVGLYGISLIFTIVVAIVLFIDTKEDKRIRVSFLIITILILVFGNTIINEFMFDIIMRVGIDAVDLLGIYYFIGFVTSTGVLGLKGYIIYCANDPKNIGLTDEGVSIIADEEEQLFKY